MKKNYNFAFFRTIKQCYMKKNMMIGINCHFHVLLNALDSNLTFGRSIKNIANNCGNIHMDATGIKYKHL